MKKLLAIMLLYLLITGQQVINCSVLAANLALSPGYTSMDGFNQISNNSNLFNMLATPTKENSTDINTVNGSVVDKQSVPIITTNKPLIKCTVSIIDKKPVCPSDTAFNADNNRNIGAFISADNHLNLDNGNILISPDRNISINTDEGTISIASGATIFIMASTTSMVLYDLQQTKPKQVCVAVRNHRLQMEPGCMLVITRQKTKCFEELDANCHCVRYRWPQAIDLKDDSMTAFAARFSISSALVRIQPLKELINSTEKQDRLLLERVIKSAVMLGV